MARFLEALRPDNLPDAPIVVREDGKGLLLGVLNPLDASCIHECSAYASWLADRQEAWWRVGTPAPNGTYALFRCTEREVELMTDSLASRTLWVAKTDELLVTSTSQRAIPWFTGSFEPNPQAMLWMLSSGTLGPDNAWDHRAHPLRPDGVVCLDRITWQLHIHEPAVTFRPDPVEDSVHRERLRRRSTCPSNTPIPMP